MEATRAGRGLLGVAVGRHGAGSPCAAIVATAETPRRPAAGEAQMKRKPVPPAARHAVAASASAHSHRGQRTAARLAATAVIAHAACSTASSASGDARRQAQSLQGRAGDSASTAAAAVAPRAAAADAPPPPPPPSPSLPRGAAAIGARQRGVDRIVERRLQAERVQSAHEPLDGRRSRRRGVAAGLARRRRRRRRRQRQRREAKLERGRDQKARDGADGRRGPAVAAPTRAGRAV